VIQAAFQGFQKLFCVYRSRFCVQQWPDPQNAITSFGLRLVKNTASNVRVKIVFIIRELSGKTGKEFPFSVKKLFERIQALSPRSFFFPGVEGL